MAIRPYILITTLNANGLNAPTTTTTKKYKATLGNSQVGDKSVNQDKVIRENTARKRKVQQTLGCKITKMYGGQINIPRRKADNFHN